MQNTSQVLGASVGCAAIYFANSVLPSFANSAYRTQTTSPDAFTAGCRTCCLTPLSAALPRKGGRPTAARSQMELHIRPTIPCVTTLASLQEWLLSRHGSRPRRQQSTFEAHDASTVSSIPHRTAACKLCTRPSNLRLSTPRFPQKRSQTRLSHHC
jgi:hypothetical protein